MSRLRTLAASVATLLALLAAAVPRAQAQTAPPTEMEVLVPTPVCVRSHGGFCVQSELQYRPTEARWVVLPNGEAIFLYWHHGQWWWVGQLEQESAAPTATVPLPTTPEPASVTPERAAPTEDDYLFARARGRGAASRVRASAQQTAQRIRQAEAEADAAPAAATPTTPQAARPAGAEEAAPSGVTNAEQTAPAAPTVEEEAPAPDADPLDAAVAGGWAATRVLSRARSIAAAAAPPPEPTAVVTPAPVVPPPAPQSTQQPPLTDEDEPEAAPEPAPVALAAVAAEAPACESDAECEDGIVCNGAELCVDGACATGGPPVVDDGDPCTVDVCDATGNQILHIRSEELCAAEGAPECVADIDCDDGLFCNGAESCDGGACAAGVAPTVDDGIPCTLDFCDEALRAVTHEPMANRCDDGLFCNGAETCDPTSGCVSGVPVVVDDQDPCTADSCVESARAVWNRFDAAACPAPVVSDDATDAAAPPPECAANADCDDGLFCNGAELCEAGRCVAGRPVDVDDGVACTEDRCDEATRRVVHTPVAARCDDGLFCNGTETCDASAGCRAGTPVAIDDADPCTTDLCDESGRRALHLFDPRECPEGPPVDPLARAADAAQIVDAATPQPTVVIVQLQTGEVTPATPTEPVEPPAPTEATEVNVSPAVAVAPAPPATSRTRPAPSAARPTAEWTELPGPPQCTADSECDDGRFCNGPERCNAGTCAPGRPPREDDGISCTVDRCDETDDVIRHVPRHALCGNGLFCDGIEQCDASVGCVPGAAPLVSDADPCTTDRCDETADRFRFEPIPECGGVP